MTFKLMHDSQIMTKSHNYESLKTDSSFITFKVVIMTFKFEIDIQDQL